MVLIILEGLAGPPLKMLPFTDFFLYGTTGAGPFRM